MTNRDETFRRDTQLGSPPPLRNEGGSNIDPSPIIDTQLGSPPPLPECFAPQTSGKLKMKEREKEGERERGRERGEWELDREGGKGRERGFEE